MFNWGLDSCGDAPCKLPQEGGRDDFAMNVNAGNAASLARV